MTEAQRLQLEVFKLLPTLEDVNVLRAIKQLVEQQIEPSKATQEIPEWEVARLRLKPTPSLEELTKGKITEPLDEKTYLALFDKHEDNGLTLKEELEMLK